jgi:MurNAc alpha-1-phosphate uridylyltransferase
MMQMWDGDAMDGLLLMASMVTAMGYEGRGDFVLDAEGHVDRPGENALTPFAYPGVQIVHPRLFDNAPQGAFSTNLLWNRAIAARRLYGTRLDGVWIHVGTPEARAEAEAYLAKLPP